MGRDASRRTIVWLLPIGMFLDERPRMRVTSFLSIFFIGVVGCASTSSSSSTPDDTGPSSHGASARSALAACRGGTNDNAFDDALEVSGGLEKSCHELVVCGGITFRLVSAIIATFTDGAKDDTKFEAGAYASGATMRITLRLPRDTSFGKKGEPIPYDLRDLGSFFVNGKLAVDLASQKVRVSFTALGPAFELLGLGRPAEGANSVVLDYAAMKGALGGITLDAKVHVDDKQGHSTFVYDMTTTPTTLGAVADGKALAFTLDDMRGERRDLGQTLVRETFDVSYVGGQVGALDGTIAFAVKGGPMPYKVSMFYPSANAPKVTFSCP